MTILVIWALLVGQPVTATHEFGDREACLRTGAVIWHQLKNEGAESIVIRCYQEPGT